MKRVLIRHSSSIPYKRQLPDQENYIWGDCQFVFDENEDYDYVVGTNHKVFESKVPKDRCILFLGEPPMVFRYKKSYLKQYGHIYGFHLDLIKKGLITDSFPIMIWMAGCTYNPQKNIWESGGVTYNDLKRMAITADGRMDRACIVTSNKSRTPGHKERMSFLNRVLNEKIDFIDIYGNGFAPIGDKLELYSKYKYVIALENCQYHNYWTEKLADTYLSGSYPLYYGCPNINDYFSENSYTPININDFETTIGTIKTMIDKNQYDKRLKDIREARELVLDKYNYFSMIRDIVENIDKDIPPRFSSPSERYIIKPQPNVPLWIRLKRRVVGLYK